MIPPKVRDPRFITIRRGGTLMDADHRLLALWVARARFSETSRDRYSTISGPERHLLVRLRLLTDRSYCRCEAGQSRHVLRRS